MAIHQNVPADPFQIFQDLSELKTPPAVQKGHLVELRYKKSLFTKIRWTTWFAH